MAFQGVQSPGGRGPYRGGLVYVGRVSRAAVTERSHCDHGECTGHKDPTHTLPGHSVLLDPTGTPQPVVGPWWLSLHVPPPRQRHESRARIPSTVSRKSSPMYGAFRGILECQGEQNILESQKQGNLRPIRNFKVGGPRTSTAANGFRSFSGLSAHQVPLNQKQLWGHQLLPTTGRAPPS